MGLLDDAIREHLELKRRRGADPDEVARQENEALGDPRAPDPENGEAAALARAAGDEVMPVTADPDATRVVEAGEPEPESDPDLDDLAPPALDPDPDPGAAYDEPDPGPQPAGPPPAREEPWLEDEPPTERPAPLPPEERPGAVAAGDEPAADEDVLEETPDFLQETPEHDRLWFEQKPPRDFDFDS